MSLKMNTFNIFNNKWSYHLIFWGSSYFVYLGIVLLILEEKSFGFSVVYSFGQIVLCSIPVYFNFYALYKLFNNKKYYLYIVSLCLIIIISGILIWSFFVYAFNDRFRLFNYIFEIIFFIGITTFIKFINDIYEQRLELQEIKTKQLQTELNLIKSQVNPHFLFNTLNNLFGLARKQDSRTADGIYQLSHIMRYIIYDSNINMIELEKELHQIRQIIELEKLRFSNDDNINVEFQVNGDLKKIRIPPMILIPFVENAFKHGISLQKYSFIKIDLEINEQNLQFSVKNSIHKDRNDDVQNSETGIGLKNVKRRLEILYPDAHELFLQEEKNTFEIILNLSF